MPRTLVVTAARGFIAILLALCPISAAGEMPSRRPNYIVIFTDDLESDMGETTDVAKAHPRVVERLLEMAQWARDDIGDHDRIDKNARFFDPKPPRPDIAKWLKE